MRRIIFKFSLEADSVVELNQEQVHYLYDVLRMRTGASIIGLDSAGKAYIVRLKSRTDAAGTVLGPVEELEREPELAVRLYVPLLKGDKLDLVVQKSVELGVADLVLFEAQRSIVKAEGNLDKKLSRLAKIARDAAQQCGRHRVPTIRGLVTIKEISSIAPGVFAWEQESGLSLQEYLHLNPPSGEMALLTGPEGGLTREEAAILSSGGWTSVTLGPRILRAETAAITVLACTMFAGGEMG